MACGRTNEVSDGELLAYLADDASAALTAHLAECSECQQRAAALAALERGLTISLFRLACPPPLQLGEYQLGLLSAADTRAVTAHLRQCPHCTAEMAMLTDYLTAVAPTIEREEALPLLERTRILVARLVDAFSNVGAPGELAMAASLRGDVGEQLVYAVDGIQVIIDVQTDMQRSAQRVLLGLVLGLPDSQTVTAYLWRTDQLIATTTVDELGNFVIDALTPGAYELILSSDKTEVHIQSLSI